MGEILNGVLLLCTAGLVTVIGKSGASNANAIFLGGFYSGTRTGLVPPVPQDATLDKLLITTIIVLVISGMYFVVWPEKNLRRNNI